MSDKTESDQGQATPPPPPAEAPKPVAPPPPEPAAAAPAEAAPADPAPEPDKPAEGWRPDRSPRRMIMFGLVILAGVLAALYAWGLPPFRASSQTTDNAYVRGQTTIIAPQVGGYVTEVLVQDFQNVQAGQVLVRIDDSIYRQRVAQGAANIAAQTASLSNSQQSQRSAEAQVKAQDAAVANARAQLQRAQADMRRVDELVDAGSVSLRERDQTLAALRQAEAGVRAAEAQRQIALEQVRSVTVGRGGLEAGVENAKATRGLADIDLQRTVVRAPRAGKLSEVTVRVGQLVNPGTQMMYLVPQRHWVVANFKEAQTAKLRVGQHATLRIDALGGAELKGTVESIAPAAGSEFSIVKPDTGSGNFVKVPQRIAVRIRIDPGQKLAERLGPGMSVVATVRTGSE